MADASVPMFEKVVTAGDALAKGRITIPKRTATEFFPCADGKTGVKVDCCDDTGVEFTITHRFWTNAKSRVMYVLQGLDVLLRRTVTSPGDTLCFRRLTNGRVAISVRKVDSKDADQRTRRPTAPPTSMARPAKVAKQPLREGGPTGKRKGRVNGRKEAGADWLPLLPGGIAAADPGQTAVWWVPEQDGVFRAVLNGNPGAPCAPQVRDHGGSMWSASVDVEGSLFQAFFDTKAAALAAFVAASALSTDASSLSVAADAADQAWLEEERVKGSGRPPAKHHQQAKGQQIQEESAQACQAAQSSVKDSCHNLHEEENAEGHEQGHTEQEQARGRSRKEDFVNSSAQVTCQLQPPKMDITTQQQQQQKQAGGQLGAKDTLEPSAEAICL